MGSMPLNASRTLHVESRLPAALEALRPLSRNLYWSWNDDATALFQRFGAERWEASGHNPVSLLQSVPQAELDAFAGDPGFLAHLARVHEAFAEYMARPAQAPIAAAGERDVVAYFSPEFALTESLPIYSGGLGVLAGDHLKSASDMGLPLVGVSLFYREGYFRQLIGPDGWQREEYTGLDLIGQPMSPVTTDAGAPLTVTVTAEGREIVLNVWRLDVGRVPLFLLDTNHEANSPADREITARVYGGDLGVRIRQEIVLGIGGVRALRAMGLNPAVCHMNEGHSALLGVERIRALMEEFGVSFEEAAIPVSAATVFTTHTAVAAGIDLFPPGLVEGQLAHVYEGLGVAAGRFLGLGRVNPGDAGEPFSMGLLGLRLSGFRNGVSQVHRRIARQLWEAAWPDVPAEQVPIESVANGVHLPTWVSHEMGAVYDTHIGRQWRDSPDDPGPWRRVFDIPDDELWRTHERQREALVSRARREQRHATARYGPPATDEPAGGQVLTQGILTIGFARRFAGYKRATLLLRDPARLDSIVNNPVRPVQILFAGKAHPRDEPAKQLIREVVQFSRRPEFRDRLVVLEGHDVALARAMVQGCDVWLNTPLRPLEASGTSGMKATANGALHLSVLDGWWAEAFRPGIGWAIGRDRPEDDAEVQDAVDAESLYALLENEVAPLFYARDGEGVPVGWVQRMKASIAACAPAFNSNRMVAEYVRRAYAPAISNWHSLLRDGAAAARAVNGWLGHVREGWGGLNVEDVVDDSPPTATLGDAVTVHVRLQPGSLDPGDIRVDIVHGAANPAGDLSATATSAMALVSRADDGTCLFAGTFAPATSGRVGYAIRVLPSHPDLHDPFAAGVVRWA